MDNIPLAPNDRQRLTEFFADVYNLGLGGRPPQSPAEQIAAAILRLADEKPEVREARRKADQENAKRYARLLDPLIPLLKSLPPNPLVGGTAEISKSWTRANRGSNAYLAAADVEKVLSHLLMGETFEFMRTTSMRLDESGRVVVELSRHLGERLIGILQDIATGPRFPFALCPRCNFLFAIQGRQRFCSARCRAAEAEEKRKGTRREYMRELMRRRRERARVQKEKRK